MLIFNLVYRSNELKNEHRALVIEKAKLERNIERRRQKIEKLLSDIKSSYQVIPVSPQIYQSLRQKVAGDIEQHQSVPYAY